MGERVATMESAARPRERWPSYVTRLLDGHVIYVNPHDFSEYVWDSIDLLALLWDRVIVDSPREGLFSETAPTPPVHRTYPLDPFLRMVELGIFVPYDWWAAVNDKRAGRLGAYWKRGPFQRILDSGNYIIREEITRSTRFIAYCDPLVERDDQSPELAAIIRSELSNLPISSTNLNLTPGTVEEIQRRISLHLNWHGVLAQILGADIFVHPRMRPVWDYKARMMSSPAIADTDDRLAWRAVIERLRLDLPRGLSVGEIADFRATAEVQEFRRWLTGAVTAARDQVSELPLDERVYLEFRRVCESHRRRNEGGSAWITGIASTLISSALGLAMSGPVGATVSGAAGLILSAALKRPVGATTRVIKRQIGADWALFFADKFDSVG